VKTKTISPQKPRETSEGKTFCEFFAGIGLVREGLEPSGWSCVYANDIAVKKQVAYEARFGKLDHFHLGDVADTKEVIARIHGNPFLATASFPCIDLSVAGHFRGFVEGNPSSSFFGFSKAIEALGSRKPPVIMLENVMGLLSASKGQDYATVAKILADLGYWIDTIVLDACHFTPQSRPRVFVFGVAPELKPTGERAHSGRLWPMDEPTMLRPENVLHHKETLKLSTGWITLSTSNPPRLTTKLADLIDLDDKQEWWNEIEVKRHHEMMSGLHRRQVDGFLSSGKRWVGTIFRRIREKTMRAEVRFDGLAGCLRTPKGGSAKQIVIAIDSGTLRMRWMSPREYARLQGTPDFPLVGTTIQQLWGFADAVCVPAISWIDQQILTPLYKSVNTTKKSDQISKLVF